MRRMMEVRRRRVPDVQVEGRRVRPRAFLQHAGAEGARRRLFGRRHLEAEPRRPRPVQGLRRRTTPRSNHKGQPTVILAKTIKGYGMGESGEAQNITHQQKKMSHESIRQLPRPLRHPGPRRQARRSALRHVSRRLARARVHARAADGARRLPAGAARQGRSRSSRPSSPRSSASSRAPRTARSRRRWRSCRSCSSCCATRTSASTSCRSSPTNRARSAWKACSASSASGTSRASSTRRRTPTS